MPEVEIFSKGFQLSGARRLACAIRSTASDDVQAKVILSVAPEDRRQKNIETSYSIAPMANSSRTAPRRVAVFSPLHMGDVLCVIPALRALCNAWPDAEFTLIGLPWARDFAARFAYIDDFLMFPGAVGLSEHAAEGQSESLPLFFSEARRRRFDVAFQMHGSGRKANALVAALGARRMFGFHPVHESATERQVLLRWQPHETQARRYLRLAAAAGAAPLGENLEFPILPHERDELAARFDHNASAMREYVCINPGARSQARRWPVERFAAVADGLALLGYTIVLAGAGYDAPLVHLLQQQLARPAINLAGRISLGAYGALIETARLIVCNDTGTAQIAAAVGTPSVVVCCATDPARRPAPDVARHALLWSHVPCRPCTHTVCPRSHECALGVTPDAVLAQAQRLLSGGNAVAA